MNKNNKASRLLLVTALLFFASLVGRKLYPDIAWLKFAFYVFEAGLVGGCADWFAVTALFSKPLGFPYHTDIVPRNRIRLINALADSVQNELLSQEVLQKQLERLPLLEKITMLIRQENINHQIMSSVKKLLGLLFSNKPELAATELWEKNIKEYAAKVSICDTLRRLLLWVIRNQKETLIYNYTFSLIKQLVQDQAVKIFIYEYLVEYKQRKEEESFLLRIFSWVAEKTEILDMEEVALAVHAGLLKAIDRMLTQEHPLRKIIRKKMIDYAGNLSEENDIVIFLEKYRAELLEKTDLQAVAIKISLLFIEQGEVGVTLKAVHASLLGRMLTRYVNYFADHAENFREAEKYFKGVLSSIIDKEKYLIGDIIRTALGALSDKDLTYFIQSKAGDDLQWIRINGVIVGGVIGGLLYLFLNFVYEPVLLLM